MEITIKRQLTIEHFEDILVTAIEGGSNYWYWIDAKDLTDLPKGSPISIEIAKKLFTNPEWKLPIYDVEDAELLGHLSQKSMIDAFQIANEMSPEILAKILDGDFDAGDADYIFQLAVMGKIIFG